MSIRMSLFRGLGLDCTRATSRRGFLAAPRIADRLPVFLSGREVPVHLHLALGRTGRRQLVAARLAGGGHVSDQPFAAGHSSDRFPESFTLDRTTRLLFAAGIEIRIVPTARAIRIEGIFHRPPALPAPVMHPGAAPSGDRSSSRLPRTRRIRIRELPWHRGTNSRHVRAMDASERTTLRGATKELREQLAFSNRLAPAVIVDMTHVSQRSFRNETLGIGAVAISPVGSEGAAVLRIGPLHPSHPGGLDAHLVEELRIHAYEMRGEHEAIRLAKAQMPSWQRNVMAARWQAARIALELDTAWLAFQEWRRTRPVSLQPAPRKGEVQTAADDPASSTGLQFA